jgi:hypothetical protein
VKLLLAKEAAILPRASVHGLPRRGYLLYATSSRTTRKRRVAIVFRSKFIVVSCSVTPSYADPSNPQHQPNAPTVLVVWLNGLPQRYSLWRVCIVVVRPFEFYSTALALFSLLSQKRLLCLHIGHCPLEESCLSHSTMQCYSHQRRPRHRTCSLLTIWKLCPHLPET